MWDIIGVLVLILISSACGADIAFYWILTRREFSIQKDNKLKIPFYAIYAYYKWRKELKNGIN